MAQTTFKRLIAEFLGTALLLAIVVGSGIMGTAVSEDAGIALLGNTLATGAGLVILILVFGPVSGAHFNPAVSLSFLVRGDLTGPLTIAYSVAQIAGAIVGVLIAHAMFSQELLQLSQTTRDLPGQLIGEAIATFGLVLTIHGCLRTRPETVPYAVGLYITAGYWFTSSTSFANPAVTLARTLTDTFAGIHFASAPGFIISQLLAALFAVWIANWIFADTPQAA